jgi:TRAP-type C4-dicarboxylate transport system permease small subunit
LIERIEKLLLKVLTFILILQGIGLVVLIGLEVFFRYIIGSALSWPEEVAGIVFVWFTLFGIALVMREDEHIAFDSLMRHSSPRVVKTVMTFCQLIIAAYALLMIYYGYTYASMFTFEKTPAARINLLWLNLAVPFSGTLLFLYSLLKILEISKPSGKARSAP